MEFGPSEYKYLYVYSGVPTMLRKYQLTNHEYYACLLGLWMNGKTTENEVDEEQTLPLVCYQPENILFKIY